MIHRDRHYIMAEAETQRDEVWEGCYDPQDLARFSVQLTVATGRVWQIPVWQSRTGSDGSSDGSEE